MGVQYYENYRKSEIFSDDEKTLIDLMTQVNYAAGQAEKAVSCRHQVSSFELKYWLSEDHPLRKALPEEPTAALYQSNRPACEAKRMIYNEAFDKSREQMIDEMSRIAAERVRELFAKNYDLIEKEFE